MNRISLLIVICLCAAVSTHGATIVWTNTLGGDWGVAENWNPNQVPGTADTALITNDGDYSVIADINPSVSNLVVGGESGTQTLVKTNGQLTIQKPSDIGIRGVFNLSATLFSTGLTVNGTLNWSGGTIANGSSVVVASNGLLNVTGTVTKTLIGLLTNQGTIVFTGQGALNTLGLGALRNFSGALLDFQTNSTIGGNGLVVNDGTMRKSSEFGAVNVTAPCTNNGVVDVQYRIIGFTYLTLGDGSSYTGPGSVGFLNGTLNGDISAENLVFVGLTLNGNGTFHGSMIWSNGTMSAGSTLTVASNGVLNLAGSGVKNIRGSITNDGLIKWTGDNTFTSIDTSGILHNLSNGLLDGQTNVSISGAGRLINDGTLRRSFPVGSFNVMVISTNNGVIDAQSGAISFSTLTMGDGSSYLGPGPVSFLVGTMAGDINSENLAFLGSSLNGNGIVHGSLLWSNGAVAVGASLTIASNSTLKVMGGLSTKTVSGLLTNAGTILCTNGMFSCASSGAIYNLAGALLDVRGDLAFGGTGLGIVNDGVIRKSGGPGTMMWSMPLNNRGTMDASFGIISMGGGETTINEGSRYVGSGTNTTSSSISITLSGNFTSENLRLDNGAGVNGSGTLHGVAVWQHATIKSGAALTVASDGILNVTGSTSVMFIQGALTNAGVINWPGIGVLQFTGGGLYNLPGGIFDLQSNASISTLNTGRFINDGTFRKSAGTGTNTVLTGVAFTNNGVVSVQTGTVRFDGSLFNTAGTLEVQGGKIASTAPLILTNGLITGSGVIEAPSLISAATVNPGAINAVLTISGNYTQQLEGTLEFDITGTEPGTSHSHVIVTGSAELNGTVGVRFAPGYAPAVGESNIVFTAASLSGDFDCFNGFLLLGENKRLLRSYTSTNMILTTVAAPDPAVPSLNISKEDQVLICWPSEFTGYALYTNDNLGTTNWVAVAGATNRFLEMPTSPVKFYGLFEE